MKQPFLVIFLLIGSLNSYAQSIKSDWVITNDTIFGKINWENDDMVCITESRDSALRLIGLKDIYKYFYSEGLTKYGTAPKPIYSSSKILKTDTSLVAILRKQQKQIDFLNKRVESFGITNSNYQYEAPSNYLERAGNLGIAKNVVFLLVSGLDVAFLTSNTADKEDIIFINAAGGVTYILLEFATYSCLKKAGYALNERSNLSAIISPTRLTLSLRF